MKYRVGDCYKFKKNSGKIQDVFQIIDIKKVGGDENKTIYSVYGKCVKVVHKFLGYNHSFYTHEDHLIELIKSTNIKKRMRISYGRSC